MSPRRGGSPGGAAGRSSTSSWKAAERAAEQRRKPAANAGAVLGAGNRCWCGQPLGHTWPGKKKKVPHPPRE